MRLKTKLPITVSGIADIMEMSTEEIRAWPLFGEVRELFKDYNFKVLSKDKLILKLLAVSEKCAIKSVDEHEKGGYYHYSTGIDNAIAAIKLCY